MLTHVLPLILCFFLQVASIKYVVTNTSYGSVEGVLYNGFQEYLGIPFASPPVNDLRWKSPQKAQSWSPKILRALKQPNSCIQPDHDYGPTSEDCLYLNIFSPQDAFKGKTNYPVALWIYGGAFFSGGINLFLYNASQLASQYGVIIVLANYRVGPLGFLFDKDQAHLPGFNTNFGLQDQQFAMKWIREEISNFGGDPEKITIFGESAGAMSVCFHLITQSSWNYFDQALLESGPCLQGSTGPHKNPKYYNMNQADSTTKDFYRKLNCNDFQCAKSKSTEEILQAGNSMNWFPTIDTVFIPQDPVSAFLNGKFHNIPIVIGTNTNESQYFTPPNVTALQLVEVVIDQFETPVAEEALVRYYNPKLTNNFESVYSQMNTDFFFYCPSRRLLHSASRSSPSNKYFNYLFNHVPSFTVCPSPWCELKGRGVYHTAEIPFVFGVYPLIGKSFTPSELALSKRIQSHWTQFFKTGIPSSSWPQWTESTEITLVLDLTDSTAVNYRGSDCDFWDTHTQ